MARGSVIRAALCTGIAALFSAQAHAQSTQATGRTLEELKAEARARADRMDIRSSASSPTRGARRSDG